MKKSKEELLNDALNIAKKNIPPAPLHLEISLQAGKKLAKEYNVDETMVLIGVCLMDIQLGEARKQNKQKEHVKMSSDFAKEFLKDYDLSKEEFDKLINCVEAHHATIPFSCIESEICANADCYRFIHPKGVFTYMKTLCKRTDDFYEQIKGLDFKLEEKHNILSLEKAKEDLEDYYKEYKKQFNAILNEKEL